MNLINFKKEFVIKFIQTSNNNFPLGEIVELINLAYDKPESWTDKIQVLDIVRINLSSLKSVLNNENNLFFIFVRKDDNKIYGCIKLYYEEFIESFEHLGEIPHFSFSLFAVHPNFQSKGIGKHLLLLGENIFKIIKASNLGEDYSKIKDNLLNEYTFDFDIERDILKRYCPRKLSLVDNIYIKVILAKADLYNFYIKYGYEETNLREDLEKSLTNITLFINSEFALLKKKIL